jgi:hypothetical protein
MPDDAVRNRASLYSLRKNSDFDFVLKGRGFSRAVNGAKSIAALAAAGDTVRNPTFSAAWLAMPDDLRSQMPL